MAYSGSTELTSVNNPPRQITLGNAPIANVRGNVLGSSLQTTTPAAGGANLWYYCSSDSATIACSAGYFTDGKQLGMRIGDGIMIVSQSSLGTSPTIAFAVLGTTNSTAGWNAVTGGMIQSS